MAGYAVQGGGSKQLASPTPTQVSLDAVVSGISWGLKAKHTCIEDIRPIATSYDTAVEHGHRLTVSPRHSPGRLSPSAIISVIGLRYAKADTCHKKILLYSSYESTIEEQKKDVKASYIEWGSCWGELLVWHGGSSLWVSCENASHPLLKSGTYASDTFRHM